MKPEFEIEQIRDFVNKGYTSVSARYVKAALQHYDELVKKCNKPAVIKSVCDHNWKEWEDEFCNAQMRCTKCKTVKQTVL